MLGNLRIIFSASGLTVNTTFNREASGGIAQETVLEAAKAGTLSTRTNDTDGTLTLGAGHGITDSEVICIFWTDDDGVLQCAYGATVGTVAGTSVPFTGAAGTVLPAQDSEITCQVETPLDCDFDGDLVEMICANAVRNGMIRFLDSGPAVLKACTITAGEPLVWWDNSGFSRPITGNPVDSVVIANGDASNTNLVTLVGLYNSDE